MLPAKKRTGIYCRVSTLDQNTDLQIRELTEYVAARGWSIYRLYEDKATGTNTNRPMLRELIRDARARKLDIVLVWKLDRFARSLRDLIGMLQELSELDVDFVSLKDSLDFSTAAGRLMAHLLGSFAEFEAALIKERVRAGLSAAKAKGKRLGRPKLRDDAKIVALREQGLSIRQIARESCTSIGAVQRALRTPA